MYSELPDNMFNDETVKNKTIEESSTKQKNSDGLSECNLNL